MRQTPASPRETLARIGLRELSNISSVMLNSVKRTGTIRDLLQTNSVRRRVHRDDLERAGVRVGIGCRELRARRIDDGLERGELRRDAGIGRHEDSLRGSASTSVASISASSLIVSIGGPLRRIWSTCGPLSVPTPCTCSVRDQRLRVVLQRNDAQHRRRSRVDQHDPPLSITMLPLRGAPAAVTAR